MPDIVRNEQIKLFAGMLDRVGTVCVAVGVVTPISGSMVGGPLPAVGFSWLVASIVIWSVVFLTLHRAAQYVLGSLQE